MANVSLAFVTCCPPLPRPVKDAPAATPIRISLFLTGNSRRLRTRSSFGSLAAESRKDDSRDVLRATLDGERGLCDALLNGICDARSGCVRHFGKGEGGELEQSCRLSLGLNGAGRGSAKRSVPSVTRPTYDIDLGEDDTESLLESVRLGNGAKGSAGEWGEMTSGVPSS